MDFTLTEEQEQLQTLARAWVDREVIPHAAAWDRAEQVDPTIVTFAAVDTYTPLADPADGYALSRTSTSSNRT